MSSDTMPCGCLGHVDYEDMCRYPALETETNELRAQVRTLDADNAALVGAIRSVLLRMLAQDWSAARETLLEASEKPCSGAALLAEMDELRAEVKRLTEERDAEKAAAREWERLRGDAYALYRKVGDENDSLRARVAELEAAQFDAESVAAKTRSELHAMEAQLDYTQTAFMDAQKAIADMETRLETAEHERGELRAGLAEALRERDRARVLLSTSEGNRAQALMDWRAATDAASHARDAALEEAKRVVREAFVLPDGPCSREQYGASVVAAGAIATINKLKSQPARRFVDAEEVRKVLAGIKATAKADLSQDGMTTTDYGNAAGREDAADRVAAALGLTLDGEVTP